MPENKITKLKSSATTAAGQTVRETAVPASTRGEVAATKATWVRNRSRIEPSNSTNSNIVTDPSAANSQTFASWSTRSPNMKVTGTTTAARRARRAATAGIAPGSRRMALALPSPLSP